MADLWQASVSVYTLRVFSSC